MTSPADRLKQARIAAGFSTAREAVERFGWTGSTYYGHENGRRGIPAKKLALYARAFNVSAAWLLSGGGAPATIHEFPRDRSALDMLLSDMTEGERKFLEDAARILIRARRTG